MRRSGIRSISEKRKAQLKAKGPTRRAWINRTTKGAKRKGPVKARNPERQAKAFVRCYHSEERVEFVNAMPCVVCGERPSVNMHTKGDGGSRKGPYTTIIPACGTDLSVSFVEGCHDESHRVGIKTFAALHGLDLEALAAATEAAWQAHTLSRTTV